MICLMFDIVCVFVALLVIAIAVAVVEAAFNTITSTITRILGWEKKDATKEAASN